MSVYNAIQQFFDSDPKAASSLVTFVVLLCTTWLARYKIPPTNWVFIVLRAVLGAVFDMIHPAEFKAVARASRKKPLGKKSGAIISPPDGMETPVVVDATVQEKKDGLV